MRLFLFSRLIIAAVLISSLSGCTDSGGGDDTSDGQSDLDVTQRAYTSITGADGIAAINFSLPAGTTAFEIEASSSTGMLQITELTDSSGHSVLYQSSAAGGTAREFSPVSIRLPYLTATIGSSYTASFRLTATDRNSSALAGESVTLTVTSKKDKDSSSGTLKVNIVLVGPVANSDTTRESLQAAFDIWKQMYIRAGISLDPKWYEIEGPDEIPDPSSGDPYYEDLALSTRTDAVNLVFASYVEGTGSQSSGNRYGVSGGRPGPVSASPRSAVALSILAMTGADGQFDLNPEQTGSTEVHNDETRLAAEEMARLTARYLGLENIVEISGSTVTKTDSLSDTASCLTKTGCGYDEASRSNLMFPFPLQKLGSYEHENGVEYYPREYLTAQQGAVLNSSVLVD